jgi:hypothetical protein
MATSGKEISLRPTFKSCWAKFSIVTNDTTARRRRERSGPSQPNAPSTRQELVRHVCAFALAPELSMHGQQIGEVQLNQDGAADPDLLLARMRNYRSIAWDLDSTLIHHRNSLILCDFIRKNPYGQKHYILTFRCFGLEHSIIDELQRKAALSAHNFSGIYNIDNHLFESFLSGFSGESIGSLREAEWAREWKARVCHELGIDALVDDARDVILPSCQKYSINYWHPDSFGA